MTYQLITFDVYTALFDIQGSLMPRIAGVVGAEADAAQLVRTWRTKQLEYALISNSLTKGRVPWRTITRRALDYSLGRARLNLSAAICEELTAAWDELEPWPEANQVLGEVRSRGYAIGLLSNGDSSMLEALGRRLATPPDYIFASERAGYYKPHPAPYALPLDALGIEASEMLHVAGSPTDVLGTKSAGLRCAWSNRHGELVLDPALKPDHEFPDLNGVLSLL